MAAKSSASQDFLAIFWDLASPSVAARADAATRLITHVAQEIKSLGKPSHVLIHEDDVTYTAAELHGADAGTARPAPLKSLPPDTAYAVQRLIRGLASSRAAARPGFAAALSMLLCALPDGWCTGSELLDLLMNATAFTRKSRGDETRNALLGRVFGVAAFAKADRIGSEDVPATARALQEAMAAASKKPWMMEIAGEVAAGIANSMPRKLGLQVAGKVLAQYMRDEPGSWSAHDAAFVCAAQPLWAGQPASACPAAVRALDTIAEEGKWSALLPALFDSAHSFPRLHNVWRRLALWWAAQGVLATDDVPAAGSGLAAPTPEPGALAKFERFWTVVFDSGLLAARSKHERKACGLAVFTAWLPFAPAPVLDIMLSRPVLQVIGINAAAKANYLRHVAQAADKAILSELARRSDPDTAATVLLAITSRGHAQWDQRVRSKVVATAQMQVPAQALWHQLGKQLAQLADPMDAASQAEAQQEGAEAAAADQSDAAESDNDSDAPSESAWSLGTDSTDASTAGPGNLATAHRAWIMDALSGTVKAAGSSADQDEDAEHFPSITRMVLGYTVLHALFHVSVQSAAGSGTAKALKTLAAAVGAEAGTCKQLGTEPATIMHMQPPLSAVSHAAMAHRLQTMVTELAGAQVRAAVTASGADSATKDTAVLSALALCEQAEAVHSVWHKLAVLAGADSEDGTPAAQFGADVTLTPLVPLNDAAHSARGAMLDTLATLTAALQSLLTAEPAAVVAHMVELGLRPAAHAAATDMPPVECVATIRRTAAGCAALLAALSVRLLLDPAAVADHANDVLTAVQALCLPATSVAEALASGSSARASKSRKSKSSKRGAKAASAEVTEADMAQATLVLTDTMLAVLSTVGRGMQEDGTASDKASGLNVTTGGAGLLREGVKLAARALVPWLTAGAVEAACAVLHAPIDELAPPVTAPGAEDDAELSASDAESGSGSEEEDSDDDEDDDDEQEEDSDAADSEPAVRLSEALSTTSTTASTLNRAMMKQLDSALSNVLTIRAQGRGREAAERARSQAVHHFKFRVLDLVEVWLQQGEGAPAAVLLALPLLRTLKELTSHARTSGAESAWYKLCMRLASLMSHGFSAKAHVAPALTDEAAAEAGISGQYAAAPVEAAGSEDVEEDMEPLDMASALSTHVTLSSVISGVIETVDAAASTRLPAFLQPAAAVAWYLYRAAAAVDASAAAAGTGKAWCNAVYGYLTVKNAKLSSAEKLLKEPVSKSPELAVALIDALTQGLAESAKPYRSAEAAGVLAKACTRHAAYLASAKQVGYATLQAKGDELAWEWVTSAPAKLLDRAAARIGALLNEWADKLRAAATAGKKAPKAARQKELLAAAKALRASSGHAALQQSAEPLDAALAAIADASRSQAVKGTVRALIRAPGAASAGTKRARGSNAKPAAAAAAKPAGKKRSRRS